MGGVGVGVIDGVGVTVGLVAPGVEVVDAATEIESVDVLSRGLSSGSVV